MRAKLDLVHRRPDMPEGAEFGIRIADDSLAPAVRPGEVVYASSRGRLRPGDVGIFRVDGRLLCRQYAEDSEGNIYLFTLNRERREGDLMLSASTPVTLYAKLLLDPLPLPGIEE